MPSIHHDEAVTPTAAKVGTKAQQTIRVIPYHQKYPLLRNGKNTTADVLARLSPGEVPRHAHKLHHKGDNDKGELGVTRSEGETRNNFEIGPRRTNVFDHNGPDSPKPDRLRDGIDVINISRHGSMLPDANIAEQELVENDHLVQPASTGSHPQVIEVKSYEAAKTPKTRTAKNTATDQATTDVIKSASDMRISDLEISDSSPLSKNGGQMESKKKVEVTLKPPTVVIPTAEADVNPSFGEDLSSVSEHIDISYSSDFDFSSVSIPGL